MIAICSATVSLSACSTVMMPCRADATASCDWDVGCVLQPCLDHSLRCCSLVCIMACVWRMLYCQCICTLPRQLCDRELIVAVVPKYPTRPWLHSHQTMGPLQTLSPLCMLSTLCLLSMTLFRLPLRLPYMLSPCYLPQFIQLTSQGADDAHTDCDSSSHNCEEHEIMLFILVGAPGCCRTTTNESPHLYCKVQITLDQ